MKQLRNSVTVACAALLALSCSDTKEEPVGGFGKDPVVFTSEIATRAVDTQWGNDAIGVYMIDHGVAAISGNVIENAENKKYTTAGDGKFTYADPSNTVRFPETGDVDFLAYYPYTATIASYAYPVNVSDQSDQEAIDLMWAKADNNGAGYNKTATGVNLQFKHMLSSLRLKVTDQSAELDMANLKVTISGLPTTASFDLSNGTIGAGAAVADIEALTGTPSGNTVQADALLIPQTDLTGVYATFTAGDKEYNWDMGSLKLDANTRHTYVINLKTDGTVAVTAESNIDNWTDDDNSGTPQDLDPEEAQGDGTKASPYYISQLAAHTGETAWVQGYVVGMESGGALVTSGFAAKTNIAIAASASETDINECVIVDIDGSAVQENLNLVDNGDILGNLIKVNGHITSASAIDNVTEQEGGGSGAVPPPGEDLDFYETFGPDFEGATGSANKSFDDFMALDQCDMGAPFVYTNESIDQTRLDFRRTNGYPNPHLWFAANWNTAFKISGIPAGYTNMELSYDLACNQASAPYDGLMVKCNDVDMTIPSGNLSATTNTFATIKFSVPDGTTEIVFYATPESNPTGRGYRLDNIKITGSK